MYPLSKLATAKVLAIVVAFVLGGYGFSTLQAKQKDSCPAPKPNPPVCCPGPVIEKPTIQEPPCCPGRIVYKPPEGSLCCPVDPKQVKKEQREFDHAQHEAA